ncbi:MAG: FAD-dependent thymidylate synthase, partial [Minisyncoccia bacterium]
LFNRLLTESYGNKASRVLEYIPCSVKVQDIYTDDELYNIYNASQIFGFSKDAICDGEKYYHTNLRELLNLDIDLEIALKYVNFTNYKVFKCTTPYFIYGQVSTHNQLTTVSHSQRFAEINLGYWKPDEIQTTQKGWNNFVENTTPNFLKHYMKNNGITRREVFARGIDMLEYRVFTIGGYTSNSNAWKHFLEQRLDKHTQLETRKFVELFREYIDIKIGD